MNNPSQQEEIKFAFHVEADGSIDPRQIVKGSAIHELPPKVYTLTSTLGRGLYLKPENDYKLPPKIYGKVHNYADRFLRAYELGNKNLGVLLLGDAGSGKTLTLKQVVTKGAELHMPTILINQAIPGEALVHFLAQITQQCIVCFDEFEKTYKAGGGENGSDDAQLNIIQLLDGTTPSTKKLIIFTANSDDNISQYLKNDRPSRIRYTVRYSRIEQDVVIDYVSHNLKNCTEEHLRAFLLVALADRGSSNGMNFDSMVELVSEMNNFNCSLDEARKLMMRRGAGVHPSFDVTIFENGVKKEVVAATPRLTGAYFGTDDHTVIVQITAPSQVEPGEWERVHVELTKEHFVGFGEARTQYEFAKDGLTFMFDQVPMEKASQTASQADAAYNARPEVKAKKEQAALEQMERARQGQSAEDIRRNPYPSAARMLSQKHLDGSSPNSGDLNAFAYTPGGRHEMYGNNQFQDPNRRY